MKLKTACKVVLVMYGTVMVLAIILGMTEGVMSQVVGYLIVADVIVTSIIRIHFVRCPHCGGSLRFFFQQYCHCCGEELDWK